MDVSQQSQRADHARRRDRVRELLDDDEALHGWDAILVGNLLNVRYLTGFSGSNAALLLGREDASSIFCTDGRYTTQAEVEVPDLERLTDRPCDLALVGRTRGSVAFEAEHTSVANHRRLLEAGAAVQLVPTSGIVEQARVVKDRFEIAALQHACAVADQAFADLLASGAVRVGASEQALSDDLEDRMRRLGADGPSFDTIVAGGPNSAIPHHRPTGRALASGDFVKFDFGALVAGYHSDMTRTVVVGSAAGWQRELYALVAQAQHAACGAARAGASGDQIDRAARSLIEQAGQGANFVHGLGHGVGLQIHEAPALAAGSAVIMEPDMCVTVEPGVYLPGRGGVRIEDSGVIHPDGYRVLTNTSKELLEL